MLPALPTPIRTPSLPFWLLVALVLIPQAARAHHPGDDFGMLALIIDGEVSFHFRDARLDAVGSVRPALPSTREAARARFAVMVQGEPYTGPVRVAFIDEGGARTEGTVEETGGIYLAHFEAGGPGSGHLRIELLRARGAAILVPVTVADPWPWKGIAAVGGCALLSFLLGRRLVADGRSTD